MGWKYYKKFWQNGEKKDLRLKDKILKDIFDFF
jgi:hypothetical protein